MELHHALAQEDDNVAEINCSCRNLILASAKIGQDRRDRDWMHSNDNLILPLWSSHFTQTTRRSHVLLPANAFYQNRSPRQTGFFFQSSQVPAIRISFLKTVFNILYTLGSLWFLHPQPKCLILAQERRSPCGLGKVSWEGTHPNRTFGCNCFHRPHSPKWNGENAPQPQP